MAFAEVVQFVADGPACLCNAHQLDGSFVKVDAPVLIDTKRPKSRSGNRDHRQDGMARKRPVSARFESGLCE